MRWALVVALLAAPPRVAIDVTPRVLFGDGTVRVRCLVLRHEENRWLIMGIAGYRASWIQLDRGSRRIHDITYPHVPCGADMAFCILEDDRGREQVVRQSFVVACGA